MMTLTVRVYQVGDKYGWRITDLGFRGVWSFLALSSSDCGDYYDTYHEADKAGWDELIRRYGPQR